MLNTCLTNFNKSCLVLGSFREKPCFQVVPTTPAKVWQMGIEMKMDGSELNHQFKRGSKGLKITLLVGLAQLAKYFDKINREGDLEDFPQVVSFHGEMASFRHICTSGEH